MLTKQIFHGFKERYCLVEGEGGIVIAVGDVKGKTENRRRR